MVKGEIRIVLLYVYFIYSMSLAIPNQKGGWKMNAVKLFSTTGSEMIAQAICPELAKRLLPYRWELNNCEKPSESTVKRFANDNLRVQVEDVRGKFVVVIHTQVPPVNDLMIELFALLDAIRNAGAAQILLVFPYMPWARSDRKDEARVSVGGQVLAEIISKVSRVGRVLLMDPHADHMKHFFEPCADEITAIYQIIDHLNRTFFTQNRREDVVLVFADSGAVDRYRKVASLLGVQTAYVDKQHDKETGRLKFNEVVGSVASKICLLIDDEILTGSTALGDANILFERGAKRIVMVAIHPVIEDVNGSTAAVVKALENSVIDSIIVTDSIPVRHKLRDDSKITVLRVAPLLAEAIARIITNKSVSDLHKMENIGLYTTP